MRAGWLIGLGALVACSGETSGLPHLALPIGGVDGQDWVTAYYFDNNPGTGVLHDYTCSALTYDGNLGTDYQLVSWAKLEAGIEVRAAAPGMVTEIQDGLSDHNHAFEGTGLGNYVAIAHENGYWTRYGHMRTGLRVAVGDRVETGDVLGRVGASGATAYPRLAFEVMSPSNTPIDPHAGTCSTLPEDTWELDDVYHAEPRVVASGVSVLPFDFEAAVLPRPDMPIVTAPGTGVAAWVLVAGLVPPSALQVDAIDPTGTVRLHLTGAGPPTYLGLTAIWVPLLAATLDTPGEWRAQIRLDGNLLLDRTFTLAP